MADEGWQAGWQPMIAAVGRNFDEGAPTFAGDPVEQSTIRRWLEPLEFDCKLHTSRETARAHGYDDIIAPAASMLMWTLPPMRQPGQVIFTSHERNAQPEDSPINNVGLELAPPTNGFFGTDLEIEFLRPVVVGSRLAQRGRRLLSCTPKETAVGKGAFIKWESDVVDENLDVVARVRTGTYAYNAHDEEIDR
ncbi:FAS1-like dehydratase domain-containing protein [Nocardioides terrisoli]|uniref:FAS1-like dehydratase domain-containing protein n=1 Tax=Nocardioides terrisoli TaxID=3388267 RepID=UPI00287B942F|nr:MaoC family dehydratase N-terminal domain-containing protein [Nocardioides marmorisolisilvae]